MTTRVKICGLSTAETMAAALDAGADYVGLVFFAASPRHLSLEAAGRLADQARGRSRIVALTVDADDDALGAIMAAVRPDMVQLHGAETPGRTGTIRTRFNVPVMKAIKVATSADAAVARTFRGLADLILFDAKPPPGQSGALPGGNGLTFDWTAIEAVKNDVSWMLSGGLTPETVSEGIRRTGAIAVDVSSGVECGPGVKDADLIRHFIAAAKAAK